jgi:hypothetical protein
MTLTRHNRGTLGRLLKIKNEYRSDFISSHGPSSFAFWLRVCTIMKGCAGGFEDLRKDI